MQMLYNVPILSAAKQHSLRGKSANTLQRFSSICKSLACRQANMHPGQGPVSKTHFRPVCRVRLTRLTVSQKQIRHFTHQLTSCYHGNNAKSASNWSVAPNNKYLIIIIILYLLEHLWCSSQQWDWRCLLSLQFFSYQIFFLYSLHASLNFPSKMSVWLSTSCWGKQSWTVGCGHLVGQYFLFWKRS